MKKRLIIVALIATCLAVLAYLGTSLVRAGAFATVEPQGPDPIAVITGFSGGTEDLVFRPDGRHAFVSSADFRDPSRAGAIYLIDTHQPHKKPRIVSGELAFPFVPHGIDLWTDDQGERLFVVNHGVGSGFGPDAGGGDVRHTIEIFDVAPDGLLTHDRTISGAELLSPNDVAAAGRDAFYATNDHGTTGILRTLEDFLLLPLANVVHFDGSSFGEVASGLRYPNGVAFDPERRLVFVAETTGGGIRTYQVKAGGALELKSDLSTPMGLDNLDIDDTGVVWSAAHPKLLDFLAHAADPAAASPFEVWRFWGYGERRELVFADTGEHASGASVAARGDGVFIVGTVFEPKVLVFDTATLSND